MNRQLPTIALTVFLCFSNAFAGKKKPTMEAWLEQRYARLSAVEEPSKIRRSALDHSDDRDRNGLFSMYPDNGYVEFSDQSWVLLTSHSAHKEDGLHDISLIRTSEGEYYYNKGHCCLPILLFSKVKVTTLDLFLKTTGKGGEAKATPWIKYLPKNNGDGRDAPAPEENENSKAEK